MTLLAPDLSVTKIVEPESVGWPLEIQVNAAIRPICGDLSCQRCFADLTGAEQHDGRYARQFLANDLFSEAGYHHRYCIVTR